MDELFGNCTMSSLNTFSVTDLTRRFLFYWDIYIKVTDTDGNAISGATVQITDVADQRCEVHARITTSSASGQKVVIVDSTSRLTAGDEVILSAFTQNAETVTIDTIDSSTQFTTTANLTKTHGLYFIHNNTSQNLTTDASGDVNDQSPIFVIITAKSSSPVAHNYQTPFIVTVSKAGYQTEYAPITYARLALAKVVYKEIALKAEVPLFIGRGKAFINTNPSDNQNMILA
jgi:hypothetical protein